MKTLRWVVLALTARSIAGRDRARRVTDREQVNKTLDMLIERKRDLFRLEDERIRNLETQATAITAAVVAFVGIVAAAAGDTALRERRLAFALLTVIPAILTVAAAARTRLLDWRYLGRAGEPRGKPSKYADDILDGTGGVKAEPWHLEMRLVAHGVGVADGIVSNAIARLRDQVPTHPLDPARIRLHVLSAWDYRLESASRRLSGKRTALRWSFIFFMLQLVASVVFLVMVAESVSF